MNKKKIFTWIESDLIMKIVKGLDQEITDLEWVNKVNCKKEELFKTAESYGLSHTDGRKKSRD